MVLSLVLPEKVINMLTIHVEQTDLWDEKNNVFIPIEDRTFTFEYSLLAISKWEEKWHIPYLQENIERTPEQELDFIKCMCNEELEDKYAYTISLLYDQVLKDYMADPHTATWFNNSNNKTNINGSVTTNETIYYMMFASGIPKECENWHLQKLLTLIRVCGEKNSPPKKMSMKERIERQRMLNESRKARLGTKG